jgi:hypothetical protein
MYYVFYWYIEGYDFPILALCVMCRGPLPLHAVHGGSSLQLSYIKTVSAKRLLIFFCTEELETNFDDNNKNQTPWLNPLKRQGIDFYRIKGFGVTCPGWDATLPRVAKP